MFRREIEDAVINYCNSNEIGIIAYRPMQAGLLTGKFTKKRVEELPESDWRKNHFLFNEPQLSINLQFVEQLRAIAGRQNISNAQLSLARVLRRQEVTAAIVGARKPSQIQETVKAGSIQLDQNEIEHIRGLLKLRDELLSKITD